VELLEVLSLVSVVLQVFLLDDGFLSDVLDNFFEGLLEMVELYEVVFHVNSGRVVRFTTMNSLATFNCVEAEQILLRFT